MKGGVGPTMRHTVTALALASGVVVALNPVAAHSQPSADRFESPHPPSYPPGSKPPSRRFRSDSPDTTASDLSMRTSGVPPDLDQRRRDGHMTPEERRLLRQHIEDAVRELYKR
ncbi:hypothetical protein [Paraburkholderia acidipaludis]|uniref:hypothetical protein n=1 Tax=Paraburkholderia acidipaludis TaxID=660537 RepID=UPI00048703BA|nr:hypothetical protein [Paraburkholderia acidipaludis]